VGICGFLWYNILVRSHFVKGNFHVQEGIAPIREGKPLDEEEVGAGAAETLLAPADIPG
jgi:hypothetical protein